MDGRQDFSGREPDLSLDVRGGAVEDAQVLPWGDGLRMVAELRALAGTLETHFVSKARDEEISWERIGIALGVSRQAAHSKHHR